MRILEVILRPGLGGAETLVSGLVRAYRADGHSVDVVALDPPNSAQDRDAIEDRMDSVIPVISQGFSRILPRQAARSVGMARWLKSHRYDVVHAHSLIPNAYARIGAMLITDAPPVVITLHSASRDFTSRRARWSERFLFRRAAAVVAVGRRGADEYRSLIPMLKSAVILIPNGVTASSSEPVYRASPRTFLALCRLTPGKGIDVLLEGFAEFRNGRADARLLVAGPAPDAAYVSSLQGLSRRLAIDDCVSFVGPRSDVALLLNEADVFVHASFAEAHSIALLEAAAAGLPIVCSDLSPVRESLGRAPTYFPSGQPHELAMALSRVCSQWPQAVASARALAPQVATRFSMDRCAAAYFTVLNSVVAARSTRDS